MTRKLASIQEIVEVNPIPNYDHIEQVKVLGYYLIAKKNEFKKGDLCVYFEIDSKLPERTVFEFMAKRKYIVKTLKMAKTISQGLAMPTSILGTPKKLYVGLDLTEIIGVAKYDPQTKKEMENNKKPNHPAINYMLQFAWFRIVYFKVFRVLFGKKAKGNFPGFIRKTSETNIQSSPSILQLFENKVAYITEKLEGQSATYALKKSNGIFTNNKFIVCSHNIALPTVTNSNYWDIAKSLDIRAVLFNYFKQTGIYVAIQGEIVGPGIQKNIYKLKELDFYVFNVYDIKAKRYFSLKEMRKFSKDTGLKLAPVIDDNFVITEDITVDKILKMSNGKSVLYDTAREGFVYRGLNQEFSFKVRSPKYLAKG